MTLAGVLSHWPTPGIRYKIDVVNFSGLGIALLRIVIALLTEKLHHALIFLSSDKYKSTQINRLANAWAIFMFRIGGRKMLE
jgi:hypothetical protein